MNATSRLRKCRRCGAVVDAGVSDVCGRCLAAILLAPEAEPMPEAEPVLRTLGDFALLETIGRGGMGIVYRARQVSLGREVAVKVLRDSRTAETEAIHRFRAEAATVAQLHHPNIVPVIEVGEEEGEYFLAMALVPGPNLAEVTREGPVLPRRAAAWTAKVARAIQHAHERGVLHRDLKPGNILVDAQDEPHVTDFGLARQFDRAHALTITGQVLGTPAYMAPEQALGLARIGPKADVYSLGALLFHLLTGRAPFVGGSISEILRHVAEQEPVSPRVLNPSVPRELASVCLKCLEKEPARRYESAAELAEDLDRWLGGQPVRAQPSTTIGRAAKWAKREPGTALAIGAAVVILWLGLAGIVWQWRKSEAARQEAVAQLWSAHLAEAGAMRISHQQGQRTDSLSALAKAARIRPSLELRNEAIAALALTDLRPTALWRPHPSPMLHSDWAADASLSNFAIRNHGTSAIELWRPGEGEGPRLSYRERNGREMRFSPNGRWLAACYYSGELVLWDLSTQQPRLLGEIAPSPQGFLMDFTADSRLLATGGTAPVIRLFDVEGNGELAPLRLAEPSELMPGFRCHPRLPIIAAAVGERVEIWDLQTYRRLRSEGFSAGVFALAWAPDGRWMATACWNDPDIQLWDTQGSEKRVLKGVSGASTHLAYCPRGELLASRGLDGTTRLWEVATGQRILETHTGLNMDFDREGTRLAYDKETQGIGIWEVVRSAVFQAWRLPGARLSPLSDVALSPDARLACWGRADGFGWFDTASGKMGEVKGGRVSAVRFHPDGQSLFTAGADGIQQWRRMVAGEVTGLDSAPMTVWAGAETDPEQAARWLALNRDGSQLAAAGPAWLRVFGTAEDLGRLNVRDLADTVSIAMDPDGRWVACASEQDGSRVYDVATGRILADLEAVNATLAADPGGHWLLVADAREYRLRETENWTVRWRLARNSSSRQGGSAVFSPGGGHLALADKPDAIRLLKAASGEELAVLEPPVRQFVRALAFSGDGSRLAARTDLGTIQIWNLHELARALRTLGLAWDLDSSDSP